MTDRTDRIRALNIAIDRAGGIGPFKVALGVTHQAVYSWKKRGYVPVDKALVIERLFATPREDIVHPDVALALRTPYQAAADVL